MIVLANVNTNICVLVQKRLNLREKAWFESWELPQGKIADFNILQTASHELEAEAGLNIKSINLGHDSMNFNGSVLSFTPFSVVKAKEHLCFHFITSSYGYPHDTLEASDHRWIPIKELSMFLISNRICPVNRPALEKLVNLPNEVLYNKLSKVESFWEVDKPTIAFDIGGILLKWDDDLLFGNLATLFNTTPQNIADVLSSKKKRHDLHLGLISPYELCVELGELFAPVSFDEFYRCWVSSLIVLHNNVDTILELKEKYPFLNFVIASNIDPISEEYLFSTTPIKNVFNNIFSSWRMNYSKPDPNFFDSISHVMSCNKILFIDDKKANIIAAQEHGWSVYEQLPNQQIDKAFLSQIIDLWRLGEYK